jgi:hypothetical protein
MSERRSWMIPGSSIGADPDFFTAWTLYDISPNDDGGKRNLNKFFSIISGHGQPLLAAVEQIEDQDLTESLMGEIYTGNHHIWCLKWIADRQGIMTEESLAKEFENLMLETGMEETATLDGNIITNGPNTNTFFIRHNSF